jgi:hypothetical protein
VKCSVACYNFAFSVPQIFFDSLNIKLREKQE